MADGQFVPKGEWEARKATAGVEFRKAAEALRRDVLASCPDGSRDAVAAALDAGLERLRERMSVALDRS